MSGNGRGTQKPSARPPFLVIGLLVALAILGFNYWNLSSSNKDLSGVNIDLQDQIRIISARKITEEQNRKDVERKYTLLETRIAAKDSDIKRLQEDIEVKNAEKERAEGDKKECTTNLQTCETNNQGIQQQLGEVNLQLDELKKKQDQTPDCNSQCKEQTQKLYVEMFQKLGAATIKQLINAGFDIGDDLKSQILQQEQANRQVQPPNQNVAEQNQPQQPQQPPQQNPADGQPKTVTGKESTAPKGIDNSFVNLKDRLKQRMQSLSNTGSLHDIVNKTQEGIKQGVESLSQKTKEGIKQGAESLSQKSALKDIINTTQAGIKQGIESLSPDMHALIDKTHEGIRQGMKKSQEIAGLIYGSDKSKEHESNNTQVVGVEKKTQNDTMKMKNDTVVGNNDPQQNGVPETKKDNPQTSATKPEDDLKAGVKVEQNDGVGGNTDPKIDENKNSATDTNGPQVQPVQDKSQQENKQVDQDPKSNHDVRYDDTEDDKDNGNMVEGNKPLKFIPEMAKKTDEDSNNPSIFRQGN